MSEEEKTDSEEVKEPKKDSKQETKGVCSHKKGPLVIIIGAAVIIILGAGAFSVLHIKQERLTRRGFIGGRLGGPGMMGYGHMSRGGYGIRKGNLSDQNTTSGKVTAVNGQTFTVDVSGQSKNVQISDTTRFPVSSATQIKTGDTVIVLGQQDSKGVIQATTIVVNPTQ